ncbi:YdbH family protein [Serratia aquatilis]|uniref:YdbH family protein n=1 Tax=Serratia aquatilis TaxID=1737515 RepID=A0ABV6ED32_9GAMM
MAKLLKFCGGILLLLFALLILIWQALPHWLPLLVNRILPTGTAISLTSSPNWRGEALTLPNVQLSVHGCRLLNVVNPHIGYRHERWELQLQRFELDSLCLSHLPVSQNGNAIALPLADLQRHLPNVQISVAQFVVAPWQKYAGRADWVAEKGSLSVHYAGEALSFNAVLDHGQRLDLQNFSLQIPELPEPLRLSGTLNLPPILGSLPFDGVLKGELNTLYTPLPLIFDLSWKQLQGKLDIREKGGEQLLAHLPWRIADRQFHIEEGEWRWPYAQQPLNGGINLTLQHWNSDWDEAEFSARLNVITAGKIGKANAVLILGPAKIGQNNNPIDFQLNGRANLADLSFTGTLPGRLHEPFDNPSVTLKSGAILRAYGNIIPKLKLNEVRWPLAGVRVSMAGVNGRLQAILRASDSYWGQFQLHLDGQAQDFWPDRGNWQWHYWGNGGLSPLQARWDVSGKGYWRDKVIAMDQFTANFDRLNYGPVTVESPKMILSRPLLWRRSAEKSHFSGSLRLNADKTRFSNGSYLPQSQLDVQLQGPSIDNFTLNGEFHAGNIGPVRLNGRWDGERLRGSGWWPKQPLTVLQPFLPADLKVKLRDGEFYAQSAFSVTRKQGLKAGGHWVVRNGDMWLSEGKLNGLDFLLSYRLKDQIWQLGVQQPVILRIKSLQNLFDMQNISANLQGFYPYSDAQPLKLSNIGVELLRGYLGLSGLTLPARQPTVLTLRKIDLSELLYVLKIKQFALSGKVNGELPVYLYDAQWLIKEGWLESSGPLTLRLEPDMLKEITKRDVVAGTALKWFSYLEISQSRININLDNLGMLQMQTETHGVNTQISNPRSVILKHRHQENILHLWRSLRFGDNLQEQLEQALLLPTRSRK